jgi:membrane-associated phospholipid phosphatase
MAPWGWIAAAYGLVMGASALGLLAAPRAWRVAVSGVMYAAVSIAVAATPWPIGQLIAPAAILVGGYWLSGPFFRDPQLGLERCLLDVDDWTLGQLRANAWIEQAPRVVLELLEAAYAAVYLVVPLGAVLLWPWGVQALEQYWTVVLGAELACYLALPWIRTRPPRSLEAPGPLDRRPVVWRQVNRAVLDRASVQANTLPSGHVAGAVAAAGAVMAVWPGAGVVLMGTAALIAVSAVAGRYHYVVDVIAGAAVGAAAVLVV